MNDDIHREAIDRDKAKDFAATATSPDEKALADINAALHALPTALAEKRAELVEAGFREDVVEKKLGDHRAGLIKQARLLQDQAEGLRGAYTDDDDPFQITRDATHIEASAHFNSLNIEKRDEALFRAIRGEDDLLAEALLTGRHGLSDLTLEKLRKRLTPDDKIEQAEKNATMRTHVNRTMAGIERAIQQLTRGAGS